MNSRWRSDGYGQPVASTTCWRRTPCSAHGGCDCSGHGGSAPVFSCPCRYARFTQRHSTRSGLVPAFFTTRTLGKILGLQVTPGVGQREKRLTKRDDEARPWTWLGIKAQVWLLSWAVLATVAIAFVVGRVQARPEPKPSFKYQVDAVPRGRRGDLLRIRVQNVSEVPARGCIASAATASQVPSNGSLLRQMANRFTRTRSIRHP